MSDGRCATCKWWVRGHVPAYLRPAAWGDDPQTGHCVLVETEDNAPGQMALAAGSKALVYGHGTGIGLWTTAEFGCVQHAPGEEAVTSEDEQTIGLDVTIDGRRFAIRARPDPASFAWQAAVAEVSDAPIDEARWWRLTPPRSMGVEALEAAAAAVVRMVQNDQAFGEHAPKAPTYDTPF